MKAQYITGLALPAMALAQTYTDCNPLTTTCPSDAALSSSTYDVDFTSGANDDWVMKNGEATYDSTNGVGFTISASGDSPTMQSDFYFFFGTVTAIAKAAPGTGIVSCVILESDDLDEIDWEWLGGDDAQVQTNYFGKGNTTTYDRGGYSAVTSPQSEWHNYTIDWNSESTTWYIDDVAVRTLNYADAVSGTNYPQTPMRVKLGTWAASGTGNAGTIEWAGGETDYSQGPFTMYVKSISITNQNPGTSYTYGDMTGDWTSIQIDGASDTTTSTVKKQKVSEAVSEEEETVSSASSSVAAKATTTASAVLYAAEASSSLSAISVITKSATEECSETAVAAVTPAVNSTASPVPTTLVECSSSIVKSNGTVTLISTTKTVDSTSETSAPSTVVSGAFSLRLDGRMFAVVSALWALSLLA